MRHEAPYSIILCLTSVKEERNPRRRKMLEINKGFPGWVAGGSGKMFEDIKERKLTVQQEQRQQSDVNVEMPEKSVTRIISLKKFARKKCDLND